MPTRHIEFDHTRLAVHLTGRGPLALLVHGYPLDHRMWLDVMHGPLAQRRTLVAVDLRGHGASPWCGDAVHSMPTFADDLAAVIRTLTDAPIDVVGLSMGGYVTEALWAQHPELVRSLVLTNTRAAADTTPVRDGRHVAIQDVVQNGRRKLAESMLQKLVLPRADTLLRARIQSMIEGTAVETIVADLRGLADRPDRTALLPTITVPTLVVAGEHDPITPQAEMQAMAQAIPGATFVVVQGAAHMTPMEQPQAFAEAVGAFWVD